MGNWFQNALSSVNDVGTTLASGISQQISGVLGGVVGGVTQGVGGGTGVVPNSLGFATNYGNQGAFSPGGIGGSSANIGAFGIQLGGGTGSSTSGIGTTGQTQGSTTFQRFINEQIDPTTGQPYKGFWSYWNKPNNVRFWVIWLCGVGFSFLLIWGLVSMFSKPKPKYRKRSKKKVKKTNVKPKMYRRV